MYWESTNVSSIFEFQEGEEFITDFLSKVKAIPIATMSEEKVTEELEKLKAELKSKNNTYIEDILARKSWWK